MVVSSLGTDCEICLHTTENEVVQVCQGATLVIPLIHLPLSPSNVKKDLDEDELSHLQDSYCLSLPESAVGVVYCLCTT